MVLELNGAVEFTPEYSLRGAQAFAEAAAAIAMEEPGIETINAEVV